MNKKRSWLEKFSDFISGKGFYLVVLVCVAAIALSGFYLVRGIRGNLSNEDDQPVSGSAHIVESGAPSAKPSAGPTGKPSAAPTARPSAVPSAAPAAKPTAGPAAEPSAVSGAAPAPAPAALVFTWPVNGSVVADFSVDALAYDVTMDDWRTHPGLDLAADVGTKVKAAAAGAVKSVEEDDLMGTVVTIDHGNGLTSEYANLAAAPTVKEGDSVRTGDVIGAVGSTAAAESGQANHLHFAMYQDNRAVDPRDYLPQ